MMRHKSGEIATILVIVSLIVLGVGTVVSSSLISRQKISTNSRAEAPACLTRTPNNTDDCVTGGNTGATIGHCVPQDGKWYRCDKEGSNNRWYGPVDDQALCESATVCTDTTASSQPAPAAPSGGACGGVKTGYGNCFGAGACVYRTYAPADPHYFNQWIYCCDTGKFWYAKDTNSQDPAKGWQKRDECTAAGAPATTATAAQTGTGSSAPGGKLYVAPGPGGGDAADIPGVNCGIDQSRPCKDTSGKRTRCIQTTAQIVNDICVENTGDPPNCGTDGQDPCPSDSKCLAGFAAVSKYTSSTVVSVRNQGDRVCQSCGTEGQSPCDGSTRGISDNSFQCNNRSVMDKKTLKCIKCGTQGIVKCDKETTGDFSQNGACSTELSVDVNSSTCVNSGDNKLATGDKLKIDCVNECTKWNKVISCNLNGLSQCTICGGAQEPVCDNTGDNVINNVLIKCLDGYEPGTSGNICQLKTNNSSIKADGTCVNPNAQIYTDGNGNTSCKLPCASGPGICSTGPMTLGNVIPGYFCPGTGFLGILIEYCVDATEVVGAFPADYVTYQCVSTAEGKKACLALAAKAGYRKCTWRAFSSQAICWDKYIQK